MVSIIAERRIATSITTAVSLSTQFASINHLPLGRTRGFIASSVLAAANGMYFLREKSFAAAEKSGIAHPNRRCWQTYEEVSIEAYEHLRALKQIRRGYQPTYYLEENRFRQ